MCGLWWIKWHWAWFSPSTSVSPANHSTDFSIIIITRGWHNRPISGRSAEWTQLDSTHHYTNLNKKKMVSLFSSRATFMQKKGEIMLLCYSVVLSVSN
jgi:hypothetical protein